MDKPPPPHSALQIFVCVCRVFAWVGRLRTGGLHSQLSKCSPHTLGGGLWLNTPSAQYNWEKASTIQSFYKLGVRGAVAVWNRNHLCHLCFFSHGWKSCVCKIWGQSLWWGQLWSYWFFLLKTVFCLFWVLPPNFTTCLFRRQKNFFCTSKLRRLETKNVQFWRQKAIKMGEKRPKDKWVPLSHIKGGRSWQSKCSANLRIGGRSSQQSKCSTTWGVGALDIPGVLRISGWRWGSQRSKCSINLGGLSTAQVFDWWGEMALSTSSGALRIWLGGGSPQSKLYEFGSLNNPSILRFGRGGLSIPSVL